MSVDRCFNGALTSKNRLYIDKMWQSLGIDPLNDTAAAIEGALVFATVNDIGTRLEEMRKDFDRKNKT